MSPANLHVDVTNVDCKNHHRVVRGGMGQIAELAPVSRRATTTRSTLERPRIVLVEATSAALNPFEPKLQRYTQVQLDRTDVEVRCGTAVIDPRTTDTTSGRRT